MPFRHSPAAHETVGSAWHDRSKKVPHWSSSTAINAPSLRPASTSFASRCTIVWHSSSTGSRKGSTPFCVA